ncbi:MAG TPA: polysaccharide pyruvyl transferase family protein [Bacteroidia bacterium]|jgi:pyruvyltransferase|nr:polysaccharide pyruvyl transferase family protein [Bacteroidia bacterium]
MKVIKVCYWKEVDNFGDLLNPYIIEKLGRCRVKYYTLKSKGQVLKSIFHSIFLKRKLDIKLIRSITNAGKGILAIGSILSKAGPLTTVWGSGFMNEDETCIEGGKILAVRGKESYRKLEELGFSNKPVFGDPALLLPIIYKPKSEERYEIGIIPHWSEFDQLYEKYSSKHKVINLVTKDVEGVIDQICSCKYVLSTSLHGIIVAHAYSVPAIWFKEGYIDTDGFKFNDYFSSVNIPYYKGYNLDAALEAESIEDFFRLNSNISLIRNNLTDIQSSLLKVAPFPLKTKYNFGHRLDPFHINS